jgi:hypothetical protein
MSSLKKILADLHARHSQEILDVLAGASLKDLQAVVGRHRSGGSQPSKTPRAPTPSRSSKPTATTGHALEMIAATLVRHLKDHGPTRSEDLRKALGYAREDMSRALALAVTWKMISKKGEKRATVYKALKQRGPKPVLNLGQRMRVAALTGRTS